jgi:hypothetical protein
MIPPAAEPCTVRPAISCARVTDQPQMADPTANITTDPRRAGLRPQISAILPHTGVTAALASKYAEPIQTKAVLDCNWAEMEGTAVVMIEKSKAARNRVNWENKSQPSLTCPEKPRWRSEDLDGHTSKAVRVTGRRSFAVLLFMVRSFRWLWKWDTYWYNSDR